MKFILKWALRLIVTIVVLLIVLPVAATVFIDQDDIKRKLDDVVFEKTGRHIEVTGPIGLTPGLDLGLYAEDIRYENADWARDQPAVSAKRLAAEVSLAALLRGKVRIDEVVIDGFKLLIETNEAGQINLVEPSDAEPAEAGPIQLPDWIEFGEVSVTNSRIVSITDKPDFVVGLRNVNLASDGRAEPLDLKAEVSLQEMELEITGQPGSLASWLGRKPSNTHLTIAVADDGSVKADGTVGDVLAWKDVDLVMDAKLASLNFLKSLLPSPPPAVTDIQAKTRLQQPGAVKTMGLAELDASLRFAGLDVIAKGQIERLIAVTGLDLGVRVNGEIDRSILPAAVPEGLTPTVDLDARITGSAESPAIDISTARVMLGTATLTAAGQVQNARGAWEQPIALELDVPDVAALGDQFGIALPALGDVNGSANLASSEGSYGLQDIELGNRGSDADVSITGAIDNLANNRDGVLNISAKVEPGFFEASGYQLPVTPQSVNAEATLKLDGQSMQLAIDQASTSIPGAAVTATGGIPDLTKPTTMSIELNGKVSSLQQLGEAFGVALPEMAPLAVNATLDAEQNKWDLNNINLTGEDERLRLDAKGAISDLGPELVADIKVDGTVKQLAAIGKAFDVELPEISPLKLSTTVAAGEGKWHLRDLNATTDEDGLKLAVAGEMSNLGPDLTADINVNGTLGIDRATRLVPAIADTVKPIQDELAPINAIAKLVARNAKAWSLQGLDASSQWLGADLGVTGDIATFTPLAGELKVALQGATDRQTALLKSYPLPVLDEIDVSLTVPLPVADNGIRDIKGSIKAGSAVLNVDGDIRQLSPLSGEGFNVVLEADDLSALIADDKVFEPGNAVNVDVDVALDPGKYSAVGKVRVGDSDLDASATWMTREDQLPKLTAEIEASKIDLVSLLQKKPKIAEVKPPSSDSKKNKLVPTDSLIPDVANRLDADIKLDVASFVTRAVELSAVQGKLVIDDGGVTSDIAARNSDGRIELGVSLKKGANNSLSARVIDFPVDAISLFTEGKMLSGGTIDLGFDLNAPSDSLAGMLEKGEGEVGVDIYNSRMQNSALALVGGDLLSNVLSLINPFTSKSDTVGLECAAVHLDIGGGEVSTEKGIAMKTDTVTLLAGGEVKFPSESLRLEIAPKARKGLGVSATSIAKMVRVGGTLSSPSVETDAKGLLKSGAAIGAALSTGGLSLFATGLFDRFKANSQVCAIARGDKGRPASREQANQAGAK